MAEIFRAPIIAPGKKRPARAPHFDAPNILLSVLIATAPFFPQQGPQPAQKPRYVHREFDPPNLVLSTLAPIATTPFGPIDTANPKRARSRGPQIDAPNLILTTLAPTVPFGSVDTFTPRPIRYQQRYSDAPNLLLSTLAPVVSGSPPFVPTDWTNAHKGPPKAITFAPPNLILSTLVATTPFFEPQWPSPARGKAKAPPFDPPNLILAELVATLPFQANIMGNWPNPYRMRPRAADFAPPFTSFPPAPPAARTQKPWYPPVTAFMPDSREHRRQIVEAVNAIRQGKQNITTDVTLTPNSTQTILTDARIGFSSAICPAMATTANGAVAITAGIWVSDQKSGSCTINHASSADIDQTVRFTITG